MTLAEFLQYAGTATGVAAIGGFILSFLVEALPGWTAAAPKLKRAVMMALCFAVPLLATAAQGQLEQEAVWTALSAGFSAFFGSQVAALRKL